MYIQEIVIDGFKSYATRTVVNGFDASFNAITGTLPAKSAHSDPDAAVLPLQMRQSMPTVGLICLKSSV
jgi:hypothetical protein